MSRAVLAPAKVNLALHVVGRRADRRHDLDSLVAFADIGDRLTVGPGDGLRVTGPFAAGVPADDANIVRRALKVVGATRAVTLDKRLPHPAGLGGGSSDAAAVLRAVGADLETDALMALGADVPVCLHGRAAFMRGAGEVVEPVDLPPLHAVLVNPGVAVPTGVVFEALATKANPPLGPFDRGDPLGWIARQRNDLEAPAIAIAPSVRDVLDAIANTGAMVARMSGSGATCFGIHRSAEDARVAVAALARPEWWVAACRLA